MVGSHQYKNNNTGQGESNVIFKDNAFDRGNMGRGQRLSQGSVQQVKVDRNDKPAGGNSGPDPGSERREPDDAGNQKQ